MNHNNNVIMQKKSEIKSTTKEFREFITLYGFKYRKSVIKHLRRAPRSHEKIANDEDEDDIEYLQECVCYLSKILKDYIKKNKYHDHNVKYHGIETIKYLFKDNDEDYNFYLINNQQYQSLPNKTLLTLNEYLEKIRSKLIQLINNDCKVKLNVNVVFRAIRNFNDKINLCIKSKNTTDIDKIFDQLIKKHEDSCKSLKILILYQKVLNQ